mmetsp:Transcript_3782/g.4357  ORF Transcript_3782/g.4357 Transcript_3782/m.4357 type:complete len:450 (+) Transcript_3782:60-1409(+)
MIQSSRLWYIIVIFIISSSTTNNVSTAFQDIPLLLPRPSSSIGIKVASSNNNNNFCSTALLAKKFDITTEEEISTKNEDLDLLLSSLPLPPSSESNEDDESMRFIRDNIPIGIQNKWLRDSGFLRTAVEILTIVSLPSLTKIYKDAVPNMIQISNSNDSFLQRLFISNLLQEEQLDEEEITKNAFQTISYGDHSMQFIDLMENIIPKNNDDNEVIAFIHGGAWGSGQPWQYRLVAKPLLDMGYNVAIIGYRTYPDADVNGQVQDIQNALLYLIEKKNKNVTTIMGHSSGCHIGLLSLMNNQQKLLLSNIKAFVGISGVYDIVKHYDYESGRGVEEISPMKPACGNNNGTYFADYSPTRLLLSNDNNDSTLPNIDMLFVHGALDDVVSWYQTLELTQAIKVKQQKKTTANFDMKILPTVGHADTVLQLMFGGETRNYILDWLTERKEKRI